VLHNVMPNDQIQVQGHGGPKVAKIADFKVCLLHRMHAIKRLTVNFDTPRQYLIFLGQIFDIRLASHDLQS